MSAAAVRLAMLATVGAVLLVLLVFVPALQAPFLVPKLAALEIAASLGLVAFALRRASTGRPVWTRSLTTGALLVLATSGLAWIAAAGRPPGAPYAVAAMARWGSLFGLACGASVLADLPDERQRALEAVTMAAASVAALGMLQHIEILPLAIPVISTPGSTFGNRNLAAEVMAMALPLGAGAALGARRASVRASTLGALGLALVFLAVTRTRGAWIGGACGLGTTLLLVRRRWLRSWRGSALAAAVVVAAIAASLPGRFNPRDAGDSKRYSAIGEVLEESFDARSTALRTRFGLWRRTVAIVRDAPVVGAGPGNWPVVFPRYAEPDATRDGVLSATRAPRQAHDDVLERAAETGFLGLGALGVLVAGVVVAVRRRLEAADGASRTTAAAAAGALVALAAVSVASFPLEMPGTLALAGFALGLVAPVRPAHDRANPPARTRALAYACLALGIALLGAAAARAERDVRCSLWLDTAERAFRQDRGPAGAAVALGALNLALEANPDDFRARLRSAQMLLRQHRAAESTRAARRALGVEPYSPNAWTALAAAELEAGDAAAARGDASHALSLLPEYPFALSVRATAAESLGDAEAAAADRERLRALALGPEDDDTARAARALARRTLDVRPAE